MRVLGLGVGCEGLAYIYEVAPRYATTPAEVWVWMIMVSGSHPTPRTSQTQIDAKSISNERCFNRDAMWIRIHT